MKHLLFALLILVSFAAMGAGRLYFSLSTPYVVSTTTPTGTIIDTSYFVQFSLGFTRNDSGTLGYVLYDSAGSIKRTGAINIPISAVRKFAADSIVIDTLNTVTTPRGFTVLSQQP